MCVKPLVLLLISASIRADFTFKNVEVTCDIENPTSDEIPFSTIVTTNRLKPHLPGDQSCFKIAIQHSTIPILHRDSLADISKTRFLLLENDAVEHVHAGAFSNVQVKDLVSLKSNKLREIRSGAFAGLQVPVLVLSLNAISYIFSDAFDNMTLLESVHLDHNRLEFLDNQWFKNTPRLNKLNFQHNQIQNVQFDVFRGLVAGNGLKSPGVDLSFNKIGAVDRDALFSVKKLEFLGLAHNLLNTLPADWLKKIKINKLDVTHNRLWCLSDGLGKPQSTNLIDWNPWNCDCLEDMLRLENTTFGKLVVNVRIGECRHRIRL